MTKTEYMLISLAEECSEIAEECSRVAIRVSKAMRFGGDEIQPGHLATNLSRLAAEMSDLLALAEILEESGVITRAMVVAKKDRVATFLAYARSLGTVDADTGEGG